MFDRIFDFVADKCATPLGGAALKGAYIASIVVLADRVAFYTGVVYDAAHGGTLINTAHILQLQNDIDKLGKTDKLDSAND